MVVIGLLPRLTSGSWLRSVAARRLIRFSALVTDIGLFVDKGDGSFCLVQCPYELYQR